MEHKIIKNLNEEIFKIYETLNIVIDSVDKIQKDSDKRIMTLIEENNNNVELINQRLNQMDLDIIYNDKVQTNKKNLLIKNIEEQLKEEEDKNKTYKMKITDRVSKLNKDNTTKIRLLKVEHKKNNKSKQILLQIKEINDKIKQNEDKTKEDKKEMIELINNLKREMKIRTRTKQNEIKGVNII